MTVQRQLPCGTSTRNSQARISSVSLLRFCVLILLTYVFDYAIAADKGRDLYKILELKKNAKADEIKKAYRKLTLKYHPDKNQGDDEAKQKFHDVADAYEILSDTEKRRKYDRCGEECVNEPERKNSGSPFGDIFGDMFGQR